MSDRASDSPLRRRHAGPIEVRRALISVSDKTGIVDFAQGLAQLGIEIVSTGGTATTLERGGSRRCGRSRI